MHNNIKASDRLPEVLFKRHCTGTQERTGKFYSKSCGQNELKRQSETVMTALLIMTIPEKVMTDFIINAPLLRL